MLSIHLCIVKKIIKYFVYCKIAFLYTQPKESDVILESI